MTEINVSFFKQSGKWYMDEKIQVIDGVDAYGLIDYLKSLTRIRKSAHIVVVHTQLQMNQEAEDLVAFPRMIVPEHIKIALRQQDE